MAWSPSHPSSAAWEPTLINLGHALRKLRRWSEALGCYHRALGLVPGQPGTYSVLGYAYHLMGDLDKAIDNYHKVCGGWGECVCVDWGEASGREMAGSKPTNTKQLKCGVLLKSVACCCCCRWKQWHAAAAVETRGMM